MTKLERLYKYDAFISYRHLPLDETIAARIQNLLERYRPPKGACSVKNARIERIFRDKTELPTSGDLDQALQNALLSSRFLIIVLSEETKHSKWCMEEIRLFKEAHGGKISHILPVLVSGDPSESIPELLRYESQIDSAGNPIQTAVEPLCCDIRSDSVQGAIRKLKTEFLRLAAPLLDCGFDDLFQRHKRRAKQQKLTAACCIGALALTLGGALYSTVSSYRAYQKNLVDSYIRQGCDTTEQDPQQSLMYFSEVLAMDPNSQAAQTASLMLLQQNIWLSNTGIADEVSATPPAMPQYGNILNSAQDGSCYSYYDGSTVTLYRPDSGSVWQIPVPTKVNPACDDDSVIEGKPYAMAISETRAIVRNAGYLYIYDLDADANSTLLTEFDLALVFRDEVSKGGLDLWNETWTDCGGRLAVLYDGASAAVINVANKQNVCLNAVHTVYGYYLNHVAFSDDGSYYALVYGNEFGITLYDPGGYVEVYDEYGNLCLQTPLDTSMSPEGAAFEPNGTRLLFWGSGQLQLWDYSTGIIAAVPLKLDTIAGATWLEDGQISVSDGSGSVFLFTPMEFVPSSDLPETTPSDEEFDIYQKEVQVAEGYWLRHNYSSIWLENENGEQVGEKINYQINKMYAQLDEGIVYFWYDNTETLIRVTINKNLTGISAQQLDTSGLKIVDLKPVTGGLVAFTGNDCMLYYPIQSNTPLQTMTFENSGIVDSSAFADSGLFATVLKSTQYYSSDSTHFNYLYTLELWDLNTGLRVSRPVTNSRYKIHSVVLTEDGWLTYQIRETAHHYLVSSQSPDKATVEYLRGIPCVTLLNENSTAVQMPSISDFTGNWNQVLNSGVYQPVEDEDAAQAYILRLDQVLQEQGADEWLRQYQALWTELENEPIALDLMCDLFRNYVRTGITQGMQDDLEPGFACMTAALIADGGKDEISLFSFTLLLAQYMLQTDAYDDLIIEYWMDLAEVTQQQLDSADEDWYYKFITIYSDRLYSALLLGYGTNAFYAALDEAYHDSLATILVDSGLDTLFYMIVGKPDKAAECFNYYIADIQSLYSYDPEQSLKETMYCVMYMLWDLHLFEQRGILSEADVCSFIDALSVDVGLCIAQVTPENLEAGLYLGDVVLAVNDVRIFNQYHMPYLLEAHPTAVLTVKRGSKLFTTEPIEGWLISGDFYAQ